MFNPVAKHSHKRNKATTFKSKKGGPYTRKTKFKEMK